MYLLEMIEDYDYEGSYTTSIVVSEDKCKLDILAISLKENLLFICGHYKGIDQRVRDLHVTREISIGDFVLTGGELPSMTIIDSIVRLMPGVLGGEQSAEIESFFDGETLEFPQYTKPADFEGLQVPEVLLSGNHAEIAKWRAAHSFKAK